MDSNFALKVIRVAVVSKDLEVMGNQCMGKNCHTVTQTTGHCAYRKLR